MERERARQLQAEAARQDAEEKERQRQIQLERRRHVEQEISDFRTAVGEVLYEVDEMTVQLNSTANYRTPYLFQDFTKGCHCDSSAKSAAFAVDGAFRSGAP
jgi:hypothetical protein